MNISEAALLKVYRKKIFKYDSSAADEIFFKKGMADFIRSLNYTPSGPGIDHWSDASGKNLKQHLIDLIWERNAGGYTTKYMHFSEKSQRVYLDNAVYEWAKLVAMLLLEELNTIAANNKT